MQSAEPLFASLDPNPFFWDHKAQVQAGCLPTQPSLGHPKDGGPAGQGGRALPNHLVSCFPGVGVAKPASLIA